MQLTKPTHRTQPTMMAAATTLEEEAEPLDKVPETQASEATENGQETTSQEAALTKAPESSATSTSSKNLLSGCGGGTTGGATASIRSMLCATPDSIEISDDIDEAQKAFLDLFKAKEEEEEEDETLDEVTADSDLSNPNRRIWVVTTAALPWRTGTAVNPLLRALYLTRGRPKHHVTLVIPFLDDVASRIKLFGAQNSFAAGGQQEQEEWIRKYCRERAHCEGTLL
jgi:hypothetical protein